MPKADVPDARHFCDFAFGSAFVFGFYQPASVSSGFTLWPLW